MDGVGRAWRYEMLDDMLMSRVLKVRVTGKVFKRRSQVITFGPSHIFKNALWALNAWFCIQCMLSLVARSYARKGGGCYPIKLWVLYLRTDCISLAKHLSLFPHNLKKNNGRKQDKKYCNWKNSIWFYICIMRLASRGNLMLAP